MSANSDAMDASPQKGIAAGWWWLLICAAVVAAVIPFFSTGLTSERVANPNVSGAPRPVEFLFGYPHWADWANYFTVIAMLIVIVICIRAWQRNPGHPNV